MIMDTPMWAIATLMVLVTPGAFFMGLSTGDTLRQVGWLRALGLCLMFYLFHEQGRIWEGDMDAALHIRLAELAVTGLLYLWLAGKALHWLWTKVRPRFWGHVAEYAQRQRMALTEAPATDEDMTGALSPAEGEVIRPPKREVER